MEITSFNEFVGVMESITGQHALCSAIMEGYEALCESKYERQENFIDTIAPAICREAKKRGFQVVSPIIAQACMETGYGKSSHARAPVYNLFGIKAYKNWKGNKVNSDTHEYENGNKVAIKSNFRAYDNLADGVSGYFDLICGNRYGFLKDVDDPKEYLCGLQKCGYSTAPDYINKGMWIINKFNLDRFDEQLAGGETKPAENSANRPAEPEQKAKPNDDDDWELPANIERGDLLKHDDKQVAAVETKKQTDDDDDWALPAGMESVYMDRPALTESYNGETVRFISEVAPLIREAAKKHGYQVASPIIAQACLETGFGRSSLAKYPYYNLFGMKCGSKWKGRKINAQTKEEFTRGCKTTINSDFRAFDSLADGIEGYFQFMNYTRYADARNQKTPLEYLSYIISKGYATGSQYVQSCMKIIERYDLTKYDDFEKSISDITAERQSESKSGTGFNLFGWLTSKFTKGDSADDYGDHLDMSIKGKYATTANLNLREKAGTRNKILVTMPRGTEVTCDGHYSVPGSGRGRWYRVTANVNGKDYNGFCHSRYLAKT